MKINGRVIQGPNVEYVIIPRPEGDIVFKCQAVLSMDEFEKLCPMPTPPDKLLPGGQRVPDLTDESYQWHVKQRGEKRYAFIVLKSLEHSNIEWDTVIWEDSNTWTNWNKDLESAGFSWNELQQIQIGISSANGINQEKLEEARNRFLASQAQLVNG